MDDIKSVKKKAELVIKNHELEEFNKSQFALITKLKKENEELKNRIEHLENILKGNSYGISSEELICIEQIENLKKISSKRELTLEEVKKLDLLIKNLRLIREQSTEVIDVSTAGEISDEELIKIAEIAPTNDNE